MKNNLTVGVLERYFYRDSVAAQEVQNATVYLTGKAQGGASKSHRSFEATAELRKP